MLLTLLRMRRFGLKQLFGHLEADFVFDDFLQRYVRRAQICRVHHERMAHGAAAGIELADATGDQIHQNVGVPNFGQCLFAEFAIQRLPSSIS